MREPGSWEGVSSQLISYWKSVSFLQKLEMVDVNQWFYSKCSNYCYKLWDLEFKSKPKTKPKSSACHMEYKLFHNSWNE